MAHTIYGDLFRAIDKEIEMYRNDIAIDMDCIAANLASDSETRFIHSTRDTGTYLWAIESKVTCNEEVKYLFGHKRPADILLDRGDVIESSAMDTSTFRYWTGKSWVEIDRVAARIIHDTLALEATKHIFK